MSGLFKDLKVVELANVLAGPAVGLFFSELGAKVIKVENKSTNGDVTRSWKLPSENVQSKSSAYYAAVNWNKATVFADFKNTSEKLKIHALIKTADVVIANYKKGDDVKLGMDYNTLKKLNPKLIYGQISGFGENSSRTAFDLVLQAETGFMFMNGTTTSGPIKMPVALIDILAAHQLKEGILVALLNKLKTGKGAKVSVSLYDAAIASLANQATNWLMAKHNPQPIGSLHPNIAPYGELFSTADKKLIVLAVGNDKQFIQLCSVLKSEKLITDKKFSTNSQRVKNRTALFEILKKEIKKHKATELMKQFIQKDIPAGRIKSVKEALEEKPAKQLLLKENTVLNGRSIRVKSNIFKITN